jgi:hypothetical protein
MSHDVSGSVLGMFSTNKDAEKKGTWISIGPAKFLLARAGGSNSKFSRAISAVLRPHQRRLTADMMSNEEAEKLSIEPFVDSVLLDWQNVRAMRQDEDGEWTVGDPIPFTKENATRIMDEHRDLFRFLLEESQRISNFAPEFAKEAAGN